MREADLLGWALDYTMPSVVRTFGSIPEDRLAVRPRPNINAPGWVFGHIAVTERLHVGMALEGVRDIPEPFWVFRAARPEEEALRAAIESRAALVGYWREVRAKTKAYLASVDDAALGRPSPACLLTDDEHNRENPAREWLVMTIKHQNEHWGQLEIIAKLLADDCRQGRT
jgi:hypothetical protein